MRDGGERLEAWSQSVIRLFLWVFLIATAVETVTEVVVFDLWSLPLSFYQVFLFAVLIRKKAWRWRPGASLKRWLSRPRNLVLVGTGAACFALDKVGDARKEGALLALAPLVGVLFFFAVCYVVAVPAGWFVRKYQRRREES